MVKRIVKDDGGVQPVRGLSEFMGSGAKNKKVIKHYQANEHLRSWWMEQPDKLWSGVETAVSILESAQVTRRMLNIKFARLYSNMEAIGFPYSNLMKSSPENSTNNRITLNIIQNIIDTCASKIAKDQPKVSVVTTGADDYFLKLRAEGLTKYLYSAFTEGEVYDNAELVFRDACVVGTGFLRVYADKDEGKIKSEWCHCDEIRIDELDGMKQKPRSMHRVHLVMRDMLLHQYPDHSDKIMSAVSALQGKIAVQSTVEMVRVIESWHLKSTKKSDDGVHCITIENCTLFSEDYDKNYFPIIPFRWMNRPLGYFGRSITEEIQTIQVEVNKIMRTIQQSQELAAVPMIFVPNEAEIAEDVIMQNFVARMVPYSGGQPPTWITPTAQNQEVYDHLQFLIAKGYEIVGISQASASGQKPAGVDSAVAMREVSDIESGRFAMVSKRWEDWFIEVGRVFIDMSKDLFAELPDLSVVYSEKKILKEIDFKKVDLKGKPFDLQTFPVSQLPDTPAGRIQTISEYIQNQWISKERGMELMNLDPDLEQEVNMQTASLRLTEKWLSEMVEEGVSHQPEPLMNLPLAQSLSQGIYCMLVHDGCPEERLQLVRNFIQQCIDLQKPPPQQLPPAPPAQPQTPQTAPAGSMNPQPVMPS
jgi:hypothetical protein